MLIGHPRPTRCHAIDPKALATVTRTTPAGTRADIDDLGIVLAPWSAALPRAYRRHAGDNRDDDRANDCPDAAGRVPSRRLIDT
jgi:hypothetical protein